MRSTLRLTCCLLFITFWVIQGFAAFTLTWGLPPVSLDSNPPIGDTDLTPKIALDPYGNAIAVWGRTTGEGASEDIWTASYSHSARIWSGPVKISGGGSASKPAISMDSSGSATIVWEEGFPSHIFSRTLSAMGVWYPPLSSPPTAVSPSGNDQTAPQVETDSSGQAVAIWMELVNGTRQIHSAVKPLHSPWIQLGQISSGNQAVTLPPYRAISFNESGEGIAVWQEERPNSHTEVHAAQFRSGNWVPSLLVASYETEDTLFPSAGIDEKGNVTIVWNRYGNGSTIESRKILEGILAEETSVISNAAYSAQRPQIGVDAAGNAVVVYERFNVGVGATPTIKLITSSIYSVEKGKWSAPIDISGPSFSPTTATGTGCPVLALNSIGDGVVLWKEFDGTHRSIQGAGISLGTWSSIRMLSSVENHQPRPFSEPSYDLAVAVNLVGNTVAIWPEDPSNTKAEQIKAASGIGLAINGPFPPFPLPIGDAQGSNAIPLTGNTAGFQVLHRFPGHGDLVNILNWSTPENVSFFKIYRGNLSNQIGTTKPPHYEDHQRTPGKTEVYLITSVDSHGHESGPLTIIVPPR
jgi:hypothetical protein